MNESTTLSPHELIFHWRQGWPEYVIKPIDDYPAIISISHECAHVAGIDIYNDAGYNRICSALKGIAIFCRDTDPYFKKNLHFFNRALQTIIHEMQAVKRLSKLQEQRDQLNNYYHNDNIQRLEREKMLKEATEASLKWHQENWTTEDQLSYEKWMLANGITPAKDRKK